MSFTFLTSLVPTCVVNMRFNCPYVSLCTVTKHFIRSHKMICIFCISILALLKLSERGGFGSGLYFLISFLRGKSYLLTVTLFVSLPPPPGKFECGNTENLESKCIQVEEARDYIEVSPVTVHFCCKFGGFGICFSLP